MLLFINVLTIWLENQIFWMYINSNFLLCFLPKSPAMSFRMPIWHSDQRQSSECFSKTTPRGNSCIQYV